MQQQQDHSGLKTLLEVDQVAVHTLYDGHKRLKHLGKLIVQERSDGSVWASLNHRTAHEILKSTVFYKIMYQKFVSYLFESIRGGFNAFSLHPEQPKIHDLENLLKKFGTVVEIGTALESSHVKRKIEYHCPNILLNSIHSQNLMTPVYEWSGHLEDKVFSMLSRSEVSQNDLSSGSPASGSQSMSDSTRRILKTAWTGMFAGIRLLNKTIMDKLSQKPSNLKALVPQSSFSQRHPTIPNKSPSNEVPKSLQNKIEDSKHKKAQQKKYNTDFPNLPVTQDIQPAHQTDVIPAQHSHSVNESNKPNTSLEPIQTTVKPIAQPKIQVEEQKVPTKVAEHPQSISTDHEQNPASQNQEADMPQEQQANGQGKKKRKNNKHKKN